MKTKVYFVRHAHPDLSIRGDMIRPLSEKGILDTKKVTNVLIDKNISIIYSSPFKRAIDTIKDFAENIDSEIKIDNDFRGRNVGEWVDDFKAFSTRQWEDFDFKIQNGESLREAQERNVGELSKVLHNYSGQNIVIGTHGTALCTIINYYKPEFGYADFWNMVDKMPYILCFIFDGSGLESIEEVIIE